MTTSIRINSTMDGDSIVDFSNSYSLEIAYFT